MLNYLLQPNFQFVDINGKPLVGGWIEVYVHNDTPIPYITKADFDGTDNPFKVPLNSKGMAVIIASGDFSYDVFCYDRFGSLFWSGIDVTIDGAGGLVIDGAELPMRIVGGKITNNGVGLTCSGTNAWAEGDYTTAIGNHSHSEGSRTIASGDNSHAEGGDTRATGEHSHAEGFRTKAGSYGHAEGAGTEASNSASHAEGRDTKASGEASHAEGRLSTASGNYSHASGYGTRATGEGSTAVGKFNDDGSSLFVVGNGTDSNNRKDVFKVDRNEDTWVMIGGVLTKVTNVSGGGGGSGGGDQFVLVRSNMTSNFTNAEYQDCVDAAANGKAVCVQFERNSRTFQAQLTQVENETGLLVFEIDVANIHITYEVSGTNNSHTITESDYQNGTPIFDTLQTAISWNAVLHNGDIFETNGFHTSGDGGSARYKVSSTGTANGMDVIELSAGKYALFQWSNEVTPEQLGAVGDGNTEDTSVFDYIINYFSSVLGDMQIKRVIRGSMGKRYKIHTLLVHDVCVSQCVFKGKGSTTGYGIRLGNRAIIERCILFDFVHAIFTSDGDSAISAVVTGCTISWCGNGVSLQSGTSQATSVDNILIENNYISRLGTLGHSSDDTPPNWNNTGCGIWLNGNWKNVNIVNNVLEYNGYAGLRLQCDRTDLEPSCTATENYFEGNKFSAIRILMQRRPCAVSIFGNQMTKLDTNVFFTTGIYCSSAVMSSGRIESPYGEYLGVVTSNSGRDVLSVNTENLCASNISIYPGALTAKTFQLIPAKCANSRYASRKMLHIDLYVRSPDPSFTMNVSYIDKNNSAQTTSVSLTPNRHEVIEIPLIDVNLYDSINYPVTCVVTSADGWFYVMITDMWIK